MHNGARVGAHDDAGFKVLPLLLGHFRAVFPCIDRGEDDTPVAIYDADAVSNVSHGSICVLQVNPLTIALNSASSEPSSEPRG